jgi:hypothetical protein
MTCRRWYFLGTAASVCSLVLAVIAGPAAAQKKQSAAPAAQASAPAASRGEQYAQLLADADTMRTYNQQIEQLIVSQQEDIASLNAQLANLDATAAAVGPLLDRMYEKLSSFVAADLPFLPDKRATSMEQLKQIMEGEGDYFNKYRRLLEVYQIELEYGRTMEAYRGKLEDGRDADFVHVGRVTLLYRTTDGTESGYWDTASRKWVADADYARAINDALSIAQEKSAADLITVPVPAAEEKRL